MRLVHYCATPITKLVERPQFNANGQPDTFKPRGLWVSDDDCEDNWPSWCADNDFDADRLALVYDVALNSDAKILVLSSVAEIDEFTERWSIRPYPEIRSNMFVDWIGVRAIWDGMIVTPYIWERRLCHEPDSMWYYGWDCASGCIWKPTAVASMRLRMSAGLASASKVTYGSVPHGQGHLAGDHPWPDALGTADPGVTPVAPPRVMSPETFRATLARLGHSQTSFAEFACVTDRSVRRWAAGDHVIPGWVAVMLGLMLARR